MPSFRTVLRDVTPWWLHKGVDSTQESEVSQGAKLLYVVASMLDAQAEKARQALLCRFPGYASSSALTKIGQDRGLMQGRSESNARFAARLLAWRSPRGHRVRGSAFALLEQLSNYFGPGTDEARALDGGASVSVIDASGTLHTRDPFGNEEFSYGETWEWDTSEKYRFWIGVDVGDVSSVWGDWGDEELFGGEWGTGAAWGQTMLGAQDAIAMRRLLYGPVPWRPAGTRCEWIVLLLDGEPLTSQETDDTWQRWSKWDAGAGAQVAARYSGWRYWAARPELNFTEGEPAVYKPAMTMPGGSVLTLSNPGAYNTDPYTWPDGTEYTPDSSVFHPKIYLVDDSSPT